MLRVSDDLGSWHWQCPVATAGRTALWRWGGRVVLTECELLVVVLAICIVGHACECACSASQVQVVTTAVQPHVGRLLVHALLAYPHITQCLQAHYTNEQGVTGQVDSSGFRVSYTSQLRPHDMGVLRLGEMHLVIPPGQAAHTSPPNLCPATCTRKLKTPLTLVYNYFHMHQTGTAISTRLIRNGQELQPLGEIRSYDFNFQGASPILSAARQLLPGDSLLTTCVFDSRKRNTTTTFGASTFNEMCYNFLAYYPRDSGINTCMHVHADSNALCGDFSGALNTGALSSVFGSAPINATAVKLGLSQGWLVPSAGSNITYKPYQPAPCHNVSKNSV